MGRGEERERFAFARACFVTWLLTCCKVDRYLYKRIGICIPYEEPENMLLGG